MSNKTSLRACAADEDETIRLRGINGRLLGALEAAIDYLRRLPKYRDRGVDVPAVLERAEKAAEEARHERRR
jgi:hypothetical protein